MDAVVVAQHVLAGGKQVAGCVHVCQREGVSLNTLIVTYLAREAGVRSVIAELT